MASWPTNGCVHALCFVAKLFHVALLAKCFKQLSGLRGLNGYRGMLRGLVAHWLVAKYFVAELHFVLARS
jgi:hypothetical protein